jgi:hypothetical protein
MEGRRRRPPAKPPSTRGSSGWGDGTCNNTLVMAGTSPGTTGLEPDHVSEVFFDAPLNPIAST